MPPMAMRQKTPGISPRAWNVLGIARTPRPTWVFVMRAMVPILESYTYISATDHGREGYIRCDSWGLFRQHGQRPHRRLLLGRGYSSWRTDSSCSRQDQFSSRL